MKTLAIYSNSKRTNLAMTAINKTPAIAKAA